MGRAFYQQATKQEMPSLFKDEGVHLRLASGRYGNVARPLRSFTPVTSVFGTVVPNKTIHFSVQDGYWTLLYLLDGAVTVNNVQEVEGHYLAVFSKPGTGITVTTKADTKLLFLSGEPINEPVAAKGNIVMNTAEKVAPAEKDFTEGKFGFLDY